MIRPILIVVIVSSVIASNTAVAERNDSAASRPSGVALTAEAQRSLRQYPPKLDGAEIEVYKTIGDVELRMYIYKPAGHVASDRRPVIVFFFGGGWRGGSPAQFARQAKYFASRGMVAMLADYRVSSRHGTKAMHCVADGKSAIRWIRKNADELGVAPDRIVASGGSAGGHVAACTGIVPGMEEPGEDLSVSSTPNAMVLFNPVMALTPINGDHPLGDRAGGMRERIGDDPRKISPYDHVAEGQPPTIIFFGTDDDLLKGARFFAAAAKKAGNRCELLTWKGMKHGFFNYGCYQNRPYVETLRAADTFLSSLGYLESDAVATGNRQSRTDGEKDERP